MWDRILLTGMIVMTVLGVAGLPILIVWELLLRDPATKFRAIYAELQPAPTPQPGDVYVRYQTYDGLIVWFTATEHHGFFGPADAREFVRRLWRYNVRHAWHAAGGPLLLLEAWRSYRQQLTSIVAQAEGVLATTVESTNEAAVQPALEAFRREHRHSVVFRFAGWLLVVIATIGAIGGAINWVINGPQGWEGMFGLLAVGGLGACLLGWIDPRSK